MAATHLITVRPVDQVVRLGNAPRRHFLDQVIFQTPGCFRLVRLFDDGLYSLSTRKRHRSHHDTRRFTSAEAHKFCLLNISHHVWPWALWVSGVTSSDVTHTRTHTHTSPCGSEQEECTSVFVLVRIGLKACLYVGCSGWPGWTQTVWKRHSVHGRQVNMAPWLPLLRPKRNIDYHEKLIVLQLIVRAHVKCSAGLSCLRFQHIGKESSVCCI